MQNKMNNQVKNNYNLLYYYTVIGSYVHMLDSYKNHINLLHI